MKRGAHHCDQPHSNRTLNRFIHVIALYFNFIENWTGFTFNFDKYNNMFGFPFLNFPFDVLYIIQIVQPSSNSRINSAIYEKMKAKKNRRRTIRTITIDNKFTLRNAHENILRSLVLMLSIWNHNYNSTLNKIQFGIEAWVVSFFERNDAYAIVYSSKMLYWITKPYECQAICQYMLTICCITIDYYGIQHKANNSIAFQCAQYTHCLLCLCFHLQSINYKIVFAESVVYFTHATNALISTFTTLLMHASLVIAQYVKPISLYAVPFMSHGVC